MTRVLMTRTDADVVVVGLGAWGAAALWQPAWRGVRTTGVERYGLANAHGSSYGESRVFRTACPASSTPWWSARCWPTWCRARSRPCRSASPTPTASE